MDIQQPPFAFTLGQWVAIRICNTTGQVRARRDGIGSANQYLVAYQGIHGPAMQTWWCEDQLVSSKKPLSVQERVQLSRQQRATRQIPQHAPVSGNAR